MMPGIHRLALGGLLCLGMVALVRLAARLARVLVYRGAGWRLRAVAFGGFCLLREGDKLRLRMGSMGIDKGVLALGAVVPQTPEIDTQEGLQTARRVLIRANRLSPAARLLRENDWMAAYVLYALLPLQVNGAARRTRSVFLREKLAGALGALRPENAGRWALEAFDLLLTEHLADPDLAEPPVIERWLDHFAQDYQALRRGKGAEIYPLLFLHVLYALKFREDNRWKVMEAHVSTLLKILPGGGVNAYYRLQTQQIIYQNEDHREELGQRKNLRHCGAWKLYGLFEDALEDEVRVNQR